VRMRWFVSDAAEVGNGVRTGKSQSEQMISA
jgi:hypothetical protein